MVMISFAPDYESEQCELASHVGVSVSLNSIQRQRQSLMGIIYIDICTGSIMENFHVQDIETLLVMRSSDERSSSARCQFNENILWVNRTTNGS